MTEVKHFFPFVGNSLIVDHTQLNRQGPDTDTQYRWAIFYANDEQERVAEAYIKRLDEARVFSHKIVTQACR
jgi:peptide-methionine (S)-S-oxide reductase